MRYLFAGVYVLVLATQLPHVYTAYANLEQQGVPLAHWTAWGAAVAFELATGVFTFRIVKGAAITGKSQIEGESKCEWRCTTTIATFE